MKFIAGEVRECIKCGKKYKITKEEIKKWTHVKILQTCQECRGKVFMEILRELAKFDG
jgi:DNA-directed RNA polymerase subunit RPC12/RpoP